MFIVYEIITAGYPEAPVPTTTKDYPIYLVMLVVVVGQGGILP